MPPYCRGSKHQKNGLAPLEERKRLCDPPNLPNLISFICLFTINMQPLALFLRKEPGGLSSIAPLRKTGEGVLQKPLQPVEEAFSASRRSFLSCSRKERVSETTTPERKSRPIRLGTAIRPFIMSAAAHTRSIFNREPMKTKRTKTER